MPARSGLRFWPAKTLGTTRIVALQGRDGVVKARLPAHQRVRVGEAAGLEFDPAMITLIDATSGRALRSALDEGVLAHG